jgi:hypothetical protein
LERRKPRLAFADRIQVERFYDVRQFVGEDYAIPTLPYPEAF